MSEIQRLFPHFQCLTEGLFGPFFDLPLQMAWVQETQNYAGLVIW